MRQPHNLSQPGSSQVLIRFAVTMIILMSVAAFSSTGFAKSLAALTWMATIVSSLVAAVRRERPLDPTLNRWDEMLGYAATFSFINIIIHATPA